MAKVVFARRDDLPSWGKWIIAMHWLSAVLVAGLIGTGFIMVYGTLDASARFDVYQFHKSAGFVGLAVLAIRIVSRALISAPAKSVSISKWELMISTAVHVALYAFPLAEVLSGWLFVSLSIIPIQTKFFGLFVVPNIARPNPVLASRMAFVHLVVAWIVVALVSGHIAAALKHHFIDRDDVLRRMLPTRQRRAPARQP